MTKNRPQTVPPLDPGFFPAVLANRRYVEQVETSGKSVPLVIGLERERGLISRFETVVHAPDSNRDAETFQYVERLIKFLLWARGGWKIHFGGPAAIGAQIQRHYSKTGERAFDVDLMSRAYSHPFEVAVMPANAVPAEREMAMAVGGHLDGCRIGFDLGASDYKVSAVIDGEVVFTAEYPWQPSTQPDPQYHYDHINSALKKAAAHMPRVDAIGGSSAGVIVDNQIMVASLLRAVPAAQFDKAKSIFLRLRDEWRVPLEVANDGDVTALAGAMSLGADGMLGIAMGSSQAGGFLDAKGRITGWLNELAFVPVDFNPAAAADEWSGDRGVGAMYFSQQAVNKLAPAASLSFPADMGLPERLKLVQESVAKGDEKAAKIFESIGVYLGYSIPLYEDFYDCRHILILGRVTSGKGGDIILDKAREILRTEFPDTLARVDLHVPDEKSRRVGQAVAAASLPAIRK